MERTARATAGLVLGILLAPLVMCRDATQMFVEVSTDVPCGSLGGTAVAVGRLDSLDPRAPTTFASSCQPSGMIGTLVIVPSGAKDDAIAFQVTTGIGVDPATCASGPPKSCIVARRSLRYLPHEGLHVRVPMKAACAGVVCDPTSTCVDGACVAATLDPEACVAAGCGEEALPRPGAPAPGAPSDAGPSSETGAPDAGDAGTFTLAPGPTFAIGLTHMCAVRDGAMLCWGSNSIDQLGMVGGDKLFPTPVPGAPANIVAISAKNNTTGALSSDGKLWLWGQSDEKEIPGFTGSRAPTPQLALLGPLGAFCLGMTHGAGLTPDGRTLVSWGHVSDTLGAEDPHPTSLGPRRGVEIACGRNLTVVRMDDGTVFTAGDNPEGLGRSRGTIDTLGPVAVTGVTGLAVGLDDVVAARATNDMRWGKNFEFQLGSPVKPLLVTASLGQTSTVVLGETFACGLASGKLSCLGSNSNGQLGNSGGNSSTPAVVTTGGDVVRAWAGQVNACALLVGGDTVCWGNNGVGQLGIGSANDSFHFTPGTVVFP